MGNLKRVEGIHPFEAAGLGTAPYQQIDVEEDEELGFCCDACGQTGLRHKHIVENSEGETFGVGSECIKKADPDWWLEIKRDMGITGDNITTPQIKRKKIYDEIMVMLNDYIETMKSGAVNTDAMYSNWKLDKFYRELKEFESVKKKQVRTLEKLKEEVAKCYGYWKRDRDTSHYA
jgi:hypothetical protein